MLGYSCSCSEKRIYEQLKYEIRGSGEFYLAGKADAWG